MRSLPEPNFPTKSASSGLSGAYGRLNHWGSTSTSGALSLLSGKTQGTAPQRTSKTHQRPTGPQGRVVSNRPAVDLGARSEWREDLRSRAYGNSIVGRQRLVGTRSGYRVWNQLDAANGPNTHTTDDAR